MSEERDYIKRRRVPRRDFHRRVGLLISGTYHIDLSTQIGEGGMMISCESILQIGQMIVVTFRLPGCPQTVVRAAVRYALPKKEGRIGNSYGLEFLNLDFSVRREIRNYVASKSAEEYKQATAS